MSSTSTLRSENPARERLTRPTVIDRPHRLVMTWTFDEAPANQQLLELSFSESEGRTTVVLTNRDISTEERRASQDVGWRGCLDQLERLLDG